jgi:putative phosphoesterase
LTHGHRQSVKSGLSNLLYRTLELECKAAIFGHTHIPCMEFAEGVHLLNPGSLTRPLGGRPSYALLTLEKGVFRASILFWDPAPTVRGGKLYDMLNQADRA